MAFSVVVTTTKQNGNYTTSRDATLERWIDAEVPVVGGSRPRAVRLGAQRSGR